MKANPIVIDWLQKFNRENKMIAAICAAPIVLKEANIIEKIAITSYPAEMDKFDNWNAVS